MKNAYTLLALIPLAAMAQAPATPAKPPGPVRTYPVLKSSVPAGYTAEAQAAGLQGTVSLYVEVGPSGEPLRIKVLHGLGLGLDEKAAEAVMQWRYIPGTQQDGQPIAVGQSAAVEFRLDGGSPWRIQLEHTRARVRVKTMMVTQAVLTKYISPGAACGSSNSTTASFQIGSDGVPRSIISDEQAVIAAFEQWRYKPAEGDGQPLEAEAQVEFACGPRPTPLQGTSTSSGVVTAPVAKYKPEPDYSEEARQEKLQGSVRMAVMLDELGYPKDISVISPLGGGLDENAMAAVLQWRFTPGMRDGKPIALRLLIDVSFHLL